MRLSCGQSLVVNSVGVGIEGSGSLAEDIAIAVGVENGLSAEQLALIPSSIEGCPVFIEGRGRPVERDAPDTKHRQETTGGITVSRFPEASGGWGTLTGHCLERREPRAEVVSGDNVARNWRTTRC